MHIEKGVSQPATIGRHIDRSDNGEAMSVESMEVWEPDENTIPIVEESGKGIATKSTHPHTDIRRSHLNVNLTPIKYANMPLKESIETRIKEGYTGKKAIRKDAVKYLKHILTGSNEEMKEIESDPDRFKSWVKANYDFLCREYGEGNIVRFTVHRDETTPHIHAVTIPLTEDGRLNAKETMGNPQKMSERQDRYAKAMEAFPLDRGIRHTGIKHETMKEYHGRINEASKDTSQLLQGMRQIFDSKPINLLNYKTVKDDLKAQISSFLKSETIHIQSSLIAKNKAITGQIKQSFKGFDYNKVTVAISRIKERVSVLDYFGSLAFVGKLGFEGKKAAEFYFSKPGQKTGSITVNAQKNLWYDHAEGKGGNIFKALQTYENQTFNEAFRKLSISGDSIASVGKTWASKTSVSNEIKEEGSTFRIVAVFDNIKHPALLGYLKSRGLSMDVIPKNVKEVHWERDGRHFFGVGIKTEKGGWVVRNQIFKGNIGQVSPLEFTYNPDKQPIKSIKIFEGFIDFLAFFKLQRSKPNHVIEAYKAIVLNSVANLKAGVEILVKLLKESPKAEVHAYLDNDEAGKSTTEKLKLIHPAVMDKSPLYADKRCKDVGELLQLFTRQKGLKNNKGLER